jgi:Ca-activated chloride channel family protein
VTFLSSWRLVFLLAPAALLIAYVVMQRNRRKTALRFTSVDLLASVAPRRPGWQRHIPATVLLGALVLLVVAFAQPTSATRTPKQRATVILALDTSGSMGASDVAPTRLVAAEQEARRFVNALPAGVQLGLVAFNTSASVLVSPTSDRTTMLAAINSLTANGGTATGDAIYLALNAISAVPPGADGTKAPAAIVLMSDGAPSIGRGDQTAAETVISAADAAKQVGVKVNTIAFGTEAGTVVIEGRTIAVPFDPAAMAQVASESGGHSFTAQTAGQLKSVYQEIGRTVGYDVHRHEITAWFTGIALALLIAAAIAALIWSQRLV